MPGLAVDVEAAVAVGWVFTTAVSGVPTKQVTSHVTVTIQHTISMAILYYCLGNIYYLKCFIIFKRNIS